MSSESLVSELAPDSFEREVLQSPATVLIEFRTAWCPPCRALVPVLEQIAADHPTELKVFTVDVEQAVPFARQFKIDAVPTLLIYHRGQLAQRLRGAPSKAILLQKLALAAPDVAAKSRACDL